MSRGKQVIPNDIGSSIYNSKVLLVGAGGIGCEVLKNMVLLGFKEIEVVDLDTIDISNLNRQFLFQKEHVKQPKALVAAEAAKKFNEEATITPHFANIMDTQFSLEWFKGFNLVFNALDNLAARRYVNKMCLLADRPLIESGTSGYLGQTSVIIKNKTECFDCVGKEIPKTFPVCTIRQTPSLPIHCVVWAKTYLFNLFFGEEEEDLSNEEDKNIVEELRKETETLLKIKSAIDKEDFPKQIFEKVFDADIHRLLTFDEMWKEKTKPTPLSYQALINNENTHNTISETSKLSIHDSLQLFIDSTRALAKRYLILKESNIKATLIFDKDDNDALHFVAGASNLRAHIFGIPMNTIFEIKAMAGNIIPAIATTNAIIAGAMLVNGIKVLSNKLDRCKNVTFLLYGSQRSQLLMTEVLPPPNPDCGVCSSDTIVLMVNIETCTLSQFLSAIHKAIIELVKKDNIKPLKDKNLETLLFNSSITDGNHRLLHDYDFQDNLDSTLFKLGIKYSGFINLNFEEDDLPHLQFFVSKSDKGILFELSKSHFDRVSKKTLIHKPDLEEPNPTKKVSNLGLETLSIEDDDIILA